MIVLSKNNWRYDLGETGLPNELVCFLRDTILNHLHHTIQPTVTQNIIGLAKEHLSGGIRIGDDSYDIMLHDSVKEGYRKFFVLVAKWPGCKLKYLSDC